MHYLKHLTVLVISLILLNVDNAQAAAQVVFIDEIQLYETLAFCEGFKEQTVIQDEIITNTERQLIAAQDTLNSQQLVITDLNAAFAEQTQACEQAIKLSKPSIWEKMKSASVFTILGVIIGVLAI